MLKVLMTSSVEGTNLLVSRVKFVSVCISVMEHSMMSGIVKWNKLMRDVPAFQSQHIMPMIPRNAREILLMYSSPHRCTCFALVHLVSTSIISFEITRKWCVESRIR